LISLSIKVLDEKDFYNMTGTVQRLASLNLKVSPAPHFSFYDENSDQFFRSSAAITQTPAFDVYQCIIESPPTGY
jgi:hypothetical protein